MKSVTFKILSCLFAINVWISSLHAQLSLDVGTGIAFNNTRFAESFNSTDYNNNYVYPVYHKNQNQKFTYSPIFNLALNAQHSENYSLRYGISTGIYSESVNYTYISENEKLNGVTQYTRTTVYGNGFLKQRFVRLEFCPTIKIKQFHVLFGIINIEHIFHFYDTKIEGTRSVDQITTSKIPASNPSLPKDSIITPLSNEAMSFSTSMTTTKHDYRTTFFPLYLGLEYELNSVKSTVVFGAKALLSREKYAGTHYSSYTIYASFRLRKKQG